jgi:CTP:molybdopterin cytidylyltransferase MocA
MATCRPTDAPARPPIAGLLLAAGAGSRYGSPKALVRGADGVPWLVRAAGTLERAGCSPVIVVLGAGGAEAEALLGESGGPGGRVVVHAADWAEGLAASLRAGLRAASALRPEPVAVAVVPVDGPDLDAATVARPYLVAHGRAGGGVRRPRHGRRCRPAVR